MAKIYIIILPKLLLGLLLAVVLTGSTTIVYAQVTNRDAAFSFNKNLGRGINFMALKMDRNQHDPYDYKLLKENHFMHVRFGSRLWQHVGPAPDFTIDPVKMQEYKNAVDWALEAGLMVVLDPIHYWRDYTDADLPMLLSMWDQIAAVFAQYPLDMVTFEIMNEPESYDIDLQAIIHQSLAVIRGISGNEARIVIVSGQAFSTRQALISAFDNNIVFPVDDPYLIGTFHYYDPRPFTKQGVDNTTLYWSAEGDNDPDWRTVAAAFDEVERANNNWATKNDTQPLPIYNGEFGVDNGAPNEDRTRWLWWIRLMSEERGFSHAIWNLYGDTDKSKGMGPWTSTEINNPSLRTLHQPVLNAYRNRYEFEAAKHMGEIVLLNKDGASNDSTAMFYGTAGDSIELTDVYIAKSGSYELTIRYKNYGTTPAIIRICSKTVPGGEVDCKIVQFPVMDNEWGAGLATLNFPAGQNNNLVFSLIEGDGYLHLDYVAISKGPFVEFRYPGTVLKLPAADIVLAVENKKQNNCSIYPNPVSDTLRINGEFKAWKLIDTQGKVLKTGSFEAIDIAMLNPGIYFLAIDNEKHKVIIE